MWSGELGQSEFTWNGSRLFYQKNSDFMVFGFGLVENLYVCICTIGYIGFDGV